MAISSNVNIKHSLTPQKITTFAQYLELYNYSIKHRDDFWAEQAKKFITWEQPWQTVANCNFAEGEISWFLGGKLNASYNCIDRHLASKGAQTAIIWEGNEPGDSKHITYKELYKNVSKFANVLRELGVQQQDTVCIYMPLIPEAIYAMLACARIGAIHSVVFGGFSAEALAHRVADCKAKLIITADAVVRGNKEVSLKQNVDKALTIVGQDIENKIKVLVAKHKNAQISWIKARDYWLHELLAKASDNCQPVACDAEQPLFILYTSGSTGKPKGIVHTTGGYLLYAAITHQYIFDYQPQEVFWCTADIGWITGHTYLVYGPLAMGATILMYEGVPSYPTSARLWEIVDKHQVATFYTAPTLLRSLMASGDQYLQTTARDSLRLLGSVGEPINPAAWQWYQQKVGKGRCEIMDTWWQTETGGILISPLPRITQQKPGAAALPFFGIKPDIVKMNGADQTGQTPQLAEEGYLTIAASWPGQARTIYGDHQRFIKTYFAQYPGWYFSGDGAKRDTDQYYWISGRVDDVINVSGHRLSTAEIESALVAHSGVAEAAVIGAKHEVKGESVYAYVRLVDGTVANDELAQELRQLVKTKIGSFAVPEVIHWAPELPKTRSGKIMRRILRKIADKDVGHLGDISTMADPGVIEQLLNS